jgi:hypothetical protein
LLVEVRELQADIGFVNDETGDRFIVRIPRPEIFNGINIGSSDANIGSSDTNIGSFSVNIGSKIEKIRLTRKEIETSILNSSIDYISLDDLANALKRNVDYLKNFIIPRMLKEGKLERLYPDTPNHPKQKYRAK